MVWSMKVEFGCHNLVVAGCNCAYRSNFYAKDKMDALRLIQPKKCIRHCCRQSGVVFRCGASGRDSSAADVPEPLVGFHGTLSVPSTAHQRHFHSFIMATPPASPSALCCHHAAWVPLLLFPPTSFEWTVYIVTVEQCIAIRRCWSSLLALSRLPRRPRAADPGKTYSPVFAKPSAHFAKHRRSRFRW
jgi:hypothetical protein